MSPLQIFGATIEPSYASATAGGKRMSPKIEQEVQDGFDFRDAAAFLGLVAIVLTAVFALSYLVVQEKRAQSLGLFVAMITGDCLLALWLWLPLRASKRIRFPLSWLMVSLCVVVTAVAQAYWDASLRQIESSPEFFRRNLFEYFFNNCVFDSMVVGFLQVRATTRGLRRKNEQLVAALASERRLHLTALRLQLNPHFMFNALNAVQHLVDEEDTRSASGMVSRLAAFLRSNLQIGSHFRALAEEFSIVEAYLDVQSAVFDGGLRVDFALPDDLADQVVASFLLQPLAENAVKFSGAPSVSNAWIKVLAEHEGNDRILIRIVNSVDPCTDGTTEGNGVGLANSIERLGLLYGRDASLTCHEREGEFEVRIELPKSSPTSGHARDANSSTSANVASRLGA